MSASLKVSFQRVEGVPFPLPKCVIVSLGNFTLSTIFLISYVIHHATHDSVNYGGDGFLRYIYYFVLLSHILLSVVILPLVLVTLSRALKENFEYHKKIAKITFPIWLYVSATGVLVYILISPYY